MKNRCMDQFLIGCRRLLWNQDGGSSGPATFKATMGLSNLGQGIRLSDLNLDRTLFHHLK